MELGWFIWPFLAIAVAAITWMVHKKSTAAGAAAKQATAGSAAPGATDGTTGTGV